MKKGKIFVLLQLDESIIFISFTFIFLRRRKIERKEAMIKNEQYYIFF